MAAKSKRLLEIEAVAKDRTASAFKRIAARAEIFARRMGGIAKRISGLFFNLRTALVGLGAGLGFRSVLNDLDDIAKSSRRLNLTVDAFNQLRFAASLAGVESQRFTAGLRFFTTRIFEAANGSRGAAEAFERFGVQLRDSSGNIRSTESILEDLADRYVNMPPGVERAALAVKVFGEENSKLATLLEGGREGIQKAREEAALYVGEIGDGAKSAEAFNDAMTRVKGAVGSVFREAVVSLAERMVGALNRFAKFVADNRERFIKFFVDLGRVMLGAFKAAAAAISVTLNGFQRFSLFVNRGVNPFTKLSEEAERAEARTRSLAAQLKQLRLERAGIRRRSADGLSDEALGKAQGRLREINTEFRALSKQYREASAALLGIKEQLQFEGSAESLKNELAKIFAEFDKVAEEVQNRTLVKGNPIVPKKEEDGEEEKGFFDGLLQGSKDVRKQLELTFERGKQVAEDFFGSIQSGLSNELAGVLDGTQSLSEAWKNFGQRFKQIAARVIADLLIMVALKKLFGAFGIELPGGTGTSTSSSTGGTPESAPAGFGVATGGVTNGRGGLTGLGFSLAGLGESLASRSRPRESEGLALTVNVSQNVTHPDADAFSRRLARESDALANAVAKKIIERPEIRRSIRGGR